MAVKLSKDFTELIENYKDDLNEEMILKGTLRRGLVMQLHSRVGKTEYLKTATTIAHILNVNNISWSQKIEVLQVSISKLTKKCLH